MNTGIGKATHLDPDALRLPQDWEVIDDVCIADPDGWNRQDFAASWSKPIDYKEWQVRAMGSTVALGLRTWKPVVPEMGVCWSRTCRARHAKTDKCTVPARNAEEYLASYPE